MWSLPPLLYTFFSFSPPETDAQIYSAEVPERAAFSEPWGTVCLSPPSPSASPTSKSPDKRACLSLIAGTATSAAMSQTCGAGELKPSITEKRKTRLNYACAVLLQIMQPEIFIPPQLPCLDRPRGLYSPGDTKDLICCSFADSSLLCCPCVLPCHSRFDWMKQQHDRHIQIAF